MKSMTTIIQEVADIHGVTPNEITASHRRKFFFNLRMQVAKIAHDEGYALIDIARALGRKHASDAHRMSHR